MMQLKARMNSHDAFKFAGEIAVDCLKRVCAGMGLPYAEKGVIGRIKQKLTSWRAGTASDPAPTWAPLLTGSIIDQLVIVRQVRNGDAHYSVEQLRSLLSQAADGEGLITVTMDAARGQLEGLEGEASATSSHPH
ncbi:MAG: hypothetical protein P4N59_11180 [Negativicutes bacterium]|nr:hypothetical protein [Negativicutes bacterium]